MHKILDPVVLVLIIIFSIVYFNIHVEQFGFHEKLFSLPVEIEHNWDYVIWIIFSIMVVDIYLKYKQIGSWKVFIKKHWLEVLMLVLIPLFSAFKIIKFSLKLVKTLKMTKSGFKISHLIHKIRKSK
jgi:hypothetical protein